MMTYYVFSETQKAKATQENGSIWSVEKDGQKVPFTDITNLAEILPAADAKIVHSSEGHPLPPVERLVTDPERYQAVQDALRPQRRSAAARMGAAKRALNKLGVT
jgi:hypothetical protein